MRLKNLELEERRLCRRSVYTISLQRCDNLTLLSNMTLAFRNVAEGKR